MSAITIKDIAKICNVGISTVSRAINDDPGINKNTQERILKVIEEYHYVPNNSARNLKMTESNTIALLIKGIDNQFFQGMLKWWGQDTQSFLVRYRVKGENCCGRVGALTVVSFLEERCLRIV